MRAFIYLSKFIFAWILFGFSVSAQSDELLMYFVKPPAPLQWQSPSALTKSLVQAQNQNLASPIGHVAVRLKCEPEGDYPGVEFLDGMTMADMGEIAFAVQEGRGLGVLIDNYTGRLHGDEFLRQIDNYSCKKGFLDSTGRSRMSFLRMKISSSTCRRIADYVQEYKRRGLDQIYGGLTAHPLRGPQKGAGCNTFGMSILEIAGLYSSEFDQKWSRQIRIPRYFIGNLSKPVHPLVIVLSGFHWASNKEPGVTARFQDPALMYDWAMEKIQTQDSSYTAEKMCNYTMGISTDLSNLETPSQPIWEK